MTPNINKFLYATDLSDNSAYAFRYAINSALKHDAGIVIFRKSCKKGSAPNEEAGFHHPVAERGIRYHISRFVRQNIGIC